MTDPLSNTPPWFQTLIAEMVEDGLIEPVPGEPGVYAKTDDPTSWKMDVTEAHFPPGLPPEGFTEGMKLSILAVMTEPRVMGTPTGHESPYGTEILATQVRPRKQRKRKDNDGDDG